MLHHSHKRSWEERADFLSGEQAEDPAICSPATEQGLLLCWLCTRTGTTVVTASWEWPQTTFSSPPQPGTACGFARLTPRTPAEFLTPETVSWSCRTINTLRTQSVWALYIPLLHFFSGVMALKDLTGPHSLFPTFTETRTPFQPFKTISRFPSDAAAWVILTSPQPCLDWSWASLRQGHLPSHVLAHPRLQIGLRCLALRTPVVLLGCPAPGWAVGQVWASPLWSQGATICYNRWVY